MLLDYGAVTDVGALRDGAAGFAFHDYCFRTTPTGCPSEPRGFANAAQHVARTREALLLTEFGSTPFAGDLTGMVQLADRNMVPWLDGPTARATTRPVPAQTRLRSIRPGHSAAQT